MRVYILLAVVAIALTGVPAASFAGTVAPQQPAAKPSGTQSAPVSTVRPQVRKLLANSPAYHPL